MNQSTLIGPTKKRLPAWSAAVITGVAVPIVTMLGLFAVPSPLAMAAGPLLTLGLMGVGIIAASAARQFTVGVVLALVNAACLTVLALALGMPVPPQPLLMGFAMIVASFSFAARGALFAKTMSHRGWMMGLFVVAGEASVLLIASVYPGVLPNWFLALLPAQWASVAIQTAIDGSPAFHAVPVVLALGGTAATTLLASKLWLRRWPYLLMFTAWIGFSAMVYFYSPLT